jgi:hypothetical protein
VGGVRDTCAVHAMRPGYHPPYSPSPHGIFILFVESPPRRVVCPQGAYPSVLDVWVRWEAKMHEMY